ncbi:sterol desaturase family protein [Sungkyunkwania multivorans]|uniref:Sterol desaturase family protein n=1 Tax=Sungkyunkwania multivorans TaxID=1173618 RepID=A0ABW3CWQ2_9FLAO
MNFNEAIAYVLEDNLILFAVPIFLVAMVLEVIISRKKHLELYYGKDTAASMWMLIFSALVEFFPKALAFIAFFYLHEISPLKDIVGRQWWAWISLFFLEDFTYYWFHRANHEIRLFWAGHVPHHSSVKMNFGTALRQGVGERVHKFFFWLWLPLLGFDALMIFTMMGISLIYQFWIHTELVGKLPAPIEFIFNTPSHHRVHHASNIRYLDCNHAGVLIIWDRMFGTFSEEKYDAKPVYGLTQNIESYHPFIVATHEYKAIKNDVSRAKKLKDKLKYIFFAPGWSHDGEDKRAKVLRAKLKESYDRR